MWFVSVTHWALLFFCFSRFSVVFVVVCVTDGIQRYTPGGDYLLAVLRSGAPKEDQEKALRSAGIRLVHSIGLGCAFAGMPAFQVFCLSVTLVTLSLWSLCLSVCTSLSLSLSLSLFGLSSCFGHSVVLASLSLSLAGLWSLWSLRFSLAISLFPLSALSPLFPLSPFLFPVSLRHCPCVPVSPLMRVTCSSLSPPAACC